MKTPKEIQYDIDELAKSGYDNSKRVTIKTVSKRIANLRCLKLYVEFIKDESIIKRSIECLKEKIKTIEMDCNYKAWVFSKGMVSIEKTKLSVYYKEMDKSRLVAQLRNLNYLLKD